MAITCYSLLEWMVMLCDGFRYMPMTVHRVARQYSKLQKAMPLLYVKLYTFQLFRALAYVHNIGQLIMHLYTLDLSTIGFDPKNSLQLRCIFSTVYSPTKKMPSSVKFYLHKRIFLYLLKLAKIKKISDASI